MDADTGATGDACHRGSKMLDEVDATEAALRLSRQHSVQTTPKNPFSISTGVGSGSEKRSVSSAKNPFAVKMASIDSTCQTDGAPPMKKANMVDKRVSANITDFNFAPGLYQMNAATQWKGDPKNMATQTKKDLVRKRSIGLTCSLLKHKDAGTMTDKPKMVNFGHVPVCKPQRSLRFSLAP